MKRIERHTQTCLETFTVYLPVHLHPTHKLKREKQCTGLSIVTARIRGVFNLVEDKFTQGVKPEKVQARKTLIIVFFMWMCTWSAAAHSCHSLTEYCIIVIKQLPIKHRPPINQTLLEIPSFYSCCCCCSLIQAPIQSRCRSKNFPALIILSPKIKRIDHFLHH